MQLPRDVVGYRRHAFPLKSYQACDAAKSGKVKLNSTFPARGHRAAGHPIGRNRMFPLKIELPPMCPSANAGSAYGSYGVVTVIWKPGLRNVTTTRKIYYSGWLENIPSMFCNCRRAKSRILSKLG